MWLWSMIATRSQIDSITAISWVITITVMPRSRLIFLRSSKIDFVVFGSSALVASSQSSTFGFVDIARAIATRCFCPPESCAGYAFIRSSRPTNFKSSAARFFASAFGTPAISIGKHTFWSTFLCARRLNCWKIIPIDCLAFRISASFIIDRFCPSKITRPAVGVSR